MIGLETLARPTGSYFEFEVRDTDFSVAGCEVCVISSFRKKD